MVSDDHGAQGLYGRCDGAIYVYDGALLPRMWVAVATLDEFYFE